jgi:hypothetical protein
MTRTGYSKQQQNQLKQLVFECSIARLPASEISKVAYDKLGIQVTENWIGRIRRSLKNDTKKEFKHLLGDSFAYKYEVMQRIKEVKEIQRRKWEIANKNHLTQEDLIRLKCLSELEESTVLLAEIYGSLPGMDQFTPTTNTDSSSSNSTSLVAEEIKSTPIFDMADVRERGRERQRGNPPSSN